jgi:hypothetical protein
MSKNVRWTIVSIDPRGRFARPIADAPEGTWAQAAAAAYLTNAPLTADIWFVPCQGQGEDFLLLESGRRVPIRWDAAPKYRFLTGGAEQDREA